MPRKTNDPQWSDPALLVLSSLAVGSRHGYAIVKDVEATAGVHLGPGTLYAVLARLETRGLIEPLPPVDRRRPYQITAAGSAVLDAEIARMGRFVELSRDRMRVRGTA